MTKASLESLAEVYKHLSVQSILDMKENFGEVSMGIIAKMNNDCLLSFDVRSGEDIVCAGFVYDAKDVYNLIVYTTTRFTQHKDECRDAIQRALNPLKDREINSIIYGGANTLLGVLYSVGFMPIKKVRGYKVLELVRR